jgi:hypothetical protein
MFVCTFAHICLGWTRIVRTRRAQPYVTLYQTYVKSGTFPAERTVHTPYIHHTYVHMHRTYVHMHRTYTIHTPYIHRTYTIHTPYIRTHARVWPSLQIRGSPHSALPTFCAVPGILSERICLTVSICGVVYLYFPILLSTCLCI